MAEQIELIYQERYAVFCRLATAVTGEVEAAHDAVQDGFAVALARRGEFRRDGSLEGWIWRIVLRRALDTRRRRILAPMPDELNREALLWAPELPHAQRDPDLAAALQVLPRRQQQMVFLRYFADLSHAEIAEISGIELGTVSATLNQARATLARRLEHTRHMKEEMQR